MALRGVHLGCPFWGFEDWRGSLYPADTRPRDFLRHYARVFDSVEGNTTFYSVPSEETVQRWRDQTPDTFRFCFKLPRRITHDRLLEDALDETDRFLDRMAPLESRLGPFLVQLPPAFGPDRLGVLEEFLAGLPRRFDFAVELRHGRFFDGGAADREVGRILADHGCERAIMDTRALRSGDAEHPDVVAARHKKPDLPVREQALGERPLVRAVFHPDAEVNEPWIARWIDVLAGWVGEGLRPYLFVHTPSNLRTPELIRDVHIRLSRAIDAGLLPEFPGERREAASGQLALL